MFVSSMAFNARVSDPAIGGTYMTLLNTFANLGGVWTTSTALWFVDVLTWKSCVGAKSTGFSCNSKLNEQVCRIHSFCIKLVFFVFLASAVHVVSKEKLKCMQRVWGF